MYKLSSMWVLFGLLLVVGGCSSGSHSSGEPSVEVGGVKGKTNDDASANGTIDPANASTKVDSANNGALTMNDDHRKVSMGQAGTTEDDLAVPFYPGSKPSELGDSKMEYQGEKAAISLRTTDDEASKVVDFYKPKVKDSKTMGSGDTMMLVGKLENGGDFSMTVSKHDGKTLIRIGTNYKTKS